MILLIEGGATKTEAFLINSQKKIVSRYKVGPTNLHVVGVDGVYKNLSKLFRQFKMEPDEYQLYLSGLKTKKDKLEIKRICKKIGIKRKLTLGCDLLGGLIRQTNDGTGIIVVSGTGSAVYGRNKDGKEAQAGGWGEKLGDEAGAYNIAIEGLKAAIRSYEGRGQKTILENKFGRIDLLTDWIKGKTKTQVAKLAPVVFKAAEKGDAAAGKIIDDAADSLLNAVNAVVKKIGNQRIILSGGNFEHQPLLRERFLRRLDVRLGQSTSAIFDRINQGDKDIAFAVERQKGNIIKIIDKVTDAFKKGGRLFYAGAGTSGRIAMMDAVECVPTFNVPKTMVQAVIAGGNKALVRPLEGAEDNFNAGSKSISSKNITGKDVVIGISASGTTPFVLGALKEAKKRKAYTVLVTSGKGADVSSVINLGTGPEVIEGSTRLKAGTAAKMVLNMISTISMMKIGKSCGKYMIDVKPTNKKLIKRAVGIVSNICGINEKESKKLLKKINYNTRRAVRIGLDKKISNLLMFGFNKDRVPKDVGTIIVFGRNVKYMSKLKKYFVAIDQEGGRVNRIKKGVTLLSTADKVKTLKDAYNRGRILAKELRPFGVKLDLAPVADVNTEETNPIIGDRSFGKNSKKVSQLTCAMIRGMQKNGLLACAKHFPGHGATKRDSHKCLPKVDISYKEWKEVHLPPFAGAIKAGVSSIMLGHILCPALDKKYPSSLSNKIVTGILREEMGFNGVVITDDIGMGAITRHYTPEETAVMAINAGADIVLVCRGVSVQKRVRKALVDAILDGRISLDRVNESIKRVKKLKGM